MEVLTTLIEYAVVVGWTQNYVKGLINYSCRLQNLRDVTLAVTSPRYLALIYCGNQR